MPDFSKARVGDRVYDIRFGEGKITSVDKSGRNFTITCSFPGTDVYEIYDRNGKWDYRHIGPVLFHAKPEISDPPPPKRKVKRQVWLNVYLNVHGSVYIYSYETKEKADDCANRDRIACVPVEWEVEE